MHNKYNLKILVTTGLYLNTKKIYNINNINIPILVLQILRLDMKERIIVGEIYRASLNFK
jgi:hypothetical protein